MRRGLYQSYLDRYGDGVMSRSTFYHRRKQFRKNLQLQLMRHQNIDVPVVNSNEKCYNNNLCLTVDDSIQSFVENAVKKIVPSTYQQSTNILSAEPSLWLNRENNEVNENQKNESLCHNYNKESEDRQNLWLHDDYDQQTEDKEIWFDAEELPLIENRYGDFEYERDKCQYNESHAKDNYNQPLCNCTSVTQGEALLMTLLLGVEESLTWKTITAILSLINTLFSKKVVLDSKYKLFQALQLNDKIISYHLFCDDCMFYFGARNTSNVKGLICKNCRNPDATSNISYFITLDMKTQITTILQDPEVQQALFEGFDNSKSDLEKSTIENITDGKVYKKLFAANKPSSHTYNFTYTFNTDGCQKSKSSKISSWPIYAIINELPIKLQSKHMIMPGIWVNSKEPNMQLFFKPFVNQANELSEKGIEWKLKDKLINCKFIPLCAVVDSVARHKILNMKKFNGIYGCTFCEYPTESVDGYRKYPISTTIFQDRTDASIKKNMELVAQSEYGKNVMGIWGPSALMNLKYFDIADGMSPDYMHAFLLGAVKQHTDILLSSFGKKYYVGNPNQLKVINERLMAFKHPTSITRSPRNIIEREIWKATEWRSWLLFYSLICLKGLLPNEYLNHLALLVEALNILLSEKIEKENLRIAGSLLIRYVVLYQEHFGKEAMTYNIHLLLHMEKSVLNLGPLWCHNTFIFENENHFLLKMEKSPTHLALQISRRFILEKSLPSLEQKLIKSNGFKIFCEKNLTGRLKNTYKVNGCTLIGKGSDYELNLTEQQLLPKQRNADLSTDLFTTVTGILQAVTAYAIKLMIY